MDLPVTGPPLLFLELNITLNLTLPMVSPSRSPSTLLSLRKHLHLHAITCHAKSPEILKLDDLSISRFVDPCNHNRTRRDDDTRTSDPRYLSLIAQSCISRLSMLHQSLQTRPGTVPPGVIVVRAERLCSTTYKDIPDSWVVEDTLSDSFIFIVSL